MGKLGRLHPDQVVEVNVTVIRHVANTCPLIGCEEKNTSPLSYSSPKPITPSSREEGIKQTQD